MAPRNTLDMTQPIFSNREVQPVTLKNWQSAFDVDVCALQLSTRIRGILDDSTKPYDDDAIHLHCRTSEFVGIIETIDAIQPEWSVRLVYTAHQLDEYYTPESIIKEWHGLSDGTRLHFTCHAYRALIQLRSNFPRSANHITVAGALAIAHCCGVEMHI